MNKIIILIAFIFIPDLSASTKIDKDKKTIINTLEAHKDRLIEISDNIWEAAEPALLEFKSSKYLWDYAEENGFKVTNPEGYVAIDRISGDAVKLVDRMEFSFNNFTAIKAWDK